MTEYQRVIDRTRTRIGAALGLRTTVAVLSAWLVVWGLVALALRGVLLVPREPLLWGLVGVVAAAIVGGVVGIRRRPSIETVRAMLDGHWNCGGLLMATGDFDARPWPITVPASPTPRIRWRGGRQIGILLGCAGFVLVCFFVPVNLMDEIGSQPMLVGAEVEKLAKKVELLKEEKILPPERTNSLEAALEQLKQDASGNDPAKTWEAMDHLEQAIAKASAETAEQAARGLEKKARAEELASALEKAQDKMPERLLREAMNSLAKDLQRAAEDDQLLADELSDESKEQLEQGTLDKEQLGELSKALGKCKACDLAKLQKLAKAKLIDPSLLEALKGECEIDPDALAELLCQCKDASAIEAACKKPGRGGISRGRGDAAMTWNDGANDKDVAFKEKVLPPAAGSLKDSQLQGVSVGDPTADKPGEQSAGGALDVSTAGRGSARTQVILPEHRKVIGRYFAREPATKTKAPAKP